MKHVLILILMVCMLASARAEEPSALRWGDTPADIPGVVPESLNEALNVPGETLTFANPADGVVWPMILAQDDAGRMGVTSTNSLQDDSRSAVTAVLSASEGDVLTVTFSLSAEEVFDRFCIRVNGDVIKTFTGEKPLMTWAWPVPASGSYALELAYEKDAADHAGEDSVFIDQVALLSGERAASALAANPAYPASGANTLTVLNADAQQIVFDDPTFALMSLFGLADYYIVPGGTAEFLATLTAGLDPEGAYIVSGSEGVARSLVPMVAAAGYTMTAAVDSAETTGYPYTVVQLYPYTGASVIDVRTAVIFPDAANADAFVRKCQADGLNVRGWEALAFSADDGGMGAP